MESEFDLDIESLHGFISDSIMNFLTDNVTTPLPVNPLISTSSTQLNITDEELDELSLCAPAHSNNQQNVLSLVIALLVLALLLQHEILLLQKQSKRYNRLGLVPYLRKPSQIPSTALECGTNGATIGLSTTKIIYLR